MSMKEAVMFAAKPYFSPMMQVRIDLRVETLDLMSASSILGGRYSTGQSNGDSTFSINEARIFLARSYLASLMAVRAILRDTTRALICSSSGRDAGFFSWCLM